MSSLIKHPKTPRYNIFLVDMTSKVSWCPIEHSAFEKWLFYFGLISGHSEHELNSALDLQDLLRKRHSRKEPYEIEEALQSTLKFMVVCHPFERIISIYKRSWKNYKHTKPHETKEPMGFKDRGTDSLKFSNTSVSLGDKRRIIEPTEDDVKPQKASFQEFVSFILDVDSDSTTEEAVPWTPYYLLCTPCLLKYQIIAKVETMTEDEIYIFRAADQHHAIESQWRGALQTSQYSSQITEETKKYFSQISKSNVHRLFEKYKLDFELFNYDFEEYIASAV